MSDDNVSRLIQLDAASGELRPSDAFPGYIEFIPSDDERTRIETFLKTELARAITDHEALFNECRENIDTYKAAKISVNGEDLLPSPLARIAADQVIAWACNTLLRPKPLCSIDPYFPGEYDVMMPVPTEQGLMAMPLKREAEKIAETWELGYEFILRERIQVHKRIRQIVTDAVTGAAPCWLKISKRDEIRTILEPTKSGITIDLSDKRETNVHVGDPVRWDVLPVFNVLRPMGEPDINAAAWFAEYTPVPADDFLLTHYAGQYPLIEDEDAEKLAKMGAAASTDKPVSAQNTTPAMPRVEVRKYLVWFYWDVRIPDMTRKRGFTLKRMSFMADFHYDGGKLLNCFRNPYDHQLRPYEPFIQIEDPHDITGSSTVGITKWHQRIKTALVGLEIENASSANNMSFFVDPDSDAYDYLLTNKKLRPNEVIPKREGEYVEAWRKGEAFGHSLLPLAQWVDQDGMRAANVSGYETGDQIPGRTPAATVSQILQSGSNQPVLFLRSIADHLVNAIKLDLRTRRQYYPLGETLHVADPDTQQILEVLFQFPAEDVIDNFRFTWTAADEAVAREREMPQLMALLKLNQDRSNFVAQVAAPLANPGLMPSQANLLFSIIKSDQEIMDRIVSLTRVDTKSFDYTDDIAAIIQERNQRLIAMQQMQQQQAQRGAPPNGNPQAGGSVPGPGARTNAGGPQGPPQQSGTPQPPGLPPPGVPEVANVA